MFFSTVACHRLWAVRIYINEYIAVRGFRFLVRVETNISEFLMNICDPSAQNSGILQAEKMVNMHDMWAKIAIFFFNFVFLKPGSFILRPEMGATP